ncbi:DUF6494 family protein [Halomonas urumqiensis]|uniref:Uncharacterized protein n=1 Tax=Halomonas urumqiensis TaxID=1684789 RepID=A0A2N7UQW2_9GAMM|nr:DUF6494 family protein [Halomonas urumqiensis]PMR82812.1 hypothetical protein C1H70_00690 [Halomonas urumqiensis]PTB01869.1 hypothetical protein C6V82_12510 [Halomonas urumqiensis]GHE21973.1 hypothetical protein GCM10017767_24940 [Halomonas urumqiensis]
MNDEAFQHSIRKLLKTVGVNTQQQIEAAVNKARDEGTLAGNETLPATVTVRVEGIDLALDFAGDITLE